MASSDSPIIGLVVPAFLILFAILWMRRSAKIRPVFNPCPICKVNIRFKLGFQRGMPSHFKSVHPEYWRFLRKWTAFNTVVALATIVIIFPLLIYNVIPARGPPTIITLVGIGVYFAVSFSALAAGIVHQHRGRVRLQREWSEKHPLQQRSYGNLRGAEVELRVVPSRARAALASGLEFLVNPITPVITQLAGFLIAKKIGKLTRLDRYEDGKLWFYNGLDMLVALDVKETPPIILDEQRIRINLKKGQVEFRTENSADINLVLSVLNPTKSIPTLDG